MKRSDNENTYRADDEKISFRDVVIRLRSWSSYIRSQWKILCISAFVAAALALAYTFLAAPVYVAQSSFVLDESEKTALAQYSNLAALAGLPMNGESNGLFAGDNIMELYRSRRVLKKTLLTPCKFDNKTELLIDRYIDFSGLRRKWENNPKLRDLNFTTDTASLTRLQDSVIFVIIKRIKTKSLAVGKPDKKLAIIDVEVRSKDELFSAYFNQKLVENVNAFYLKTRSTRDLRNMNLLQQQTDSVRRVLNQSVAGAAMAEDVVPNANPDRSILHTGSQKKGIDIQASSGVYAELVKNLELSKITLRKETPLIQIIDSPELPLEKEEPSKLWWPAGAAFVGVLLALLYVVLKKGLSEVN